MHPRMTHMQASARDAYEHIFASARALAFVNAYSGSAVVPALSNAFAEHKQAFHHPTFAYVGGDTCSDYRTKHLLPSP
jgi:hypothetical protein